MKSMNLPVLSMKTRSLVTERHTGIMIQ